MSPGLTFQPFFKQVLTTTQLFHAAHTFSGSILSKFSVHKRCGHIGKVVILYWKTQDRKWSRNSIVLKQTYSRKISVFPVCVQAHMCVWRWGRQELVKVLPACLGWGRWRTAPTGPGPENPVHSSVWRISLIWHLFLIHFDFLIKEIFMNLLLQTAMQNILTHKSSSFY